MNKVLRDLLRGVMWLAILLMVYLAAVFLLPYLKSSGHAQGGHTKVKQPIAFCHHNNSVS